MDLSSTSTTKPQTESKSYSNEQQNVQCPIDLEHTGSGEDYPIMSDWVIHEYVVHPFLKWHVTV